MVTKLEMGKKFIMDMIEQSVSAYEQRDELCNKLQNLEGKSQNEQNLHLQVRAPAKNIQNLSILKLINSHRRSVFLSFIEGNA